MPLNSVARRRKVEIDFMEGHGARTANAYVQRKGAVDKAVRAKGYTEDTQGKKQRGGKEKGERVFFSSLLTIQT